MLHVITPELDFRALHSFPLDVIGLIMMDEALHFVANVDGWCILYAMPLTESEVIETR